MREYFVRGVSLQSERENSRGFVGRAPDGLHVMAKAMTRKATTEGMKCWAKLPVAAWRIELQGKGEGATNKRERPTDHISMPHRTP